MSGEHVDLRNLRDETVIALVARQHEAALGELYDRSGGLVYAVALRITGDRQTAEEVVQDVFQNIWQTAASYRAELGSVTTWLASIARHRAIDAMRSRRERTRMREQAIDEAFLPENGDPDQQVTQLALRDAVREALAALPANQRQAVEMAYYSGLTRNEIAERLGEPLGTVKTRLRLALTKLRDLLLPFAE